jgi:hypothetical protein
MSTTVKVEVIPPCNFCESDAYADAKTDKGPWANVCRLHYVAYGCTLGLGLGQRFVLERVLFADLEVNEEPVSPEHETSLARVTRLIEKARKADSIIPLSEKEEGDWSRRIHQAKANAEFVAIRTRPRYRKGRGHAAKKSVTFTEKNSVEEGA